MTLRIDEDETELERTIDHNLAQDDWDISAPNPWLQSLLPEQPMIHEGNPFATPADALEHFGVKGMKWGVRKERAQNLQSAASAGGVITRTAKNGDKFEVRPANATKFNKALAALSKSYADVYSKGANLTIHDKSGKQIGDAMFDFRPKGEMYLNWISIEKSARGQGYASEVLKAAEVYGRKNGSTRMTLEVPGNSPDARHIYEKMGFKVTKEADPAEKDPKSKKYDPTWNGLTHMEKKLDK